MKNPPKAAASPGASPIGELINGRYKVESCIARQAQSSVYLAEDRKDSGRRKVIKALTLGDSDKRGFEKLAKEFETLRRIGHPGVVQCYEFGHHSSLGAFFVMEHLEWPTLESVGPNLSQKQIIRVLYELGSILHSIHLHGILHLDLKPDNIFIDWDSLSEKDDADQITVKIADFGLARDIDFDDDDELFGAFVYTAPERFDSRKPDARADVYSLGMIGLVLLTQQVPYDANASLPLMTQKKRFFPRIEQWPDSVPRSLAMVLTRSLHPSPAFRPATARDLAVELAPHLRQNRHGVGYLPNPPFVGRGAEFKQLGSLLHDVNEGQQWAFLLSGEEGVGKSRLITEFILGRQLRGYRCLRIDGGDLDSLLKTVSFELFNQEEDEDFQFQELMTERLFSRLVEAAARETLIIAWYDFDKADLRLQRAFLKFFLENRECSLFWLLEVSHDPGILASIGYSEGIVRRKLGGVSKEAAAEMISEMLGDAEGCKELAEALCAKVGHKPGWLILALNELVRSRVVSFAEAQWIIRDPQLKGWRNALGSTWAFQPEGLSEVTRSLIEWVAVLDRPIVLEEIVQLMEITPSAVGRIIEELESRGFAEVSNGLIRIVQPIIQEQIYRSIDVNRRAQAHKGVGRWLEERLEQYPAIPDLISVAKQYYHANSKSDFRRIMLLVVKQSGKLDTVQADAGLITLLQEGLELSEGAWPQDMRVKGYLLLGDLLIDQGMFEEAAILYQGLIKDKALATLIDLPNVQLKLGKALFQTGRFNEAKQNYSHAFKKLERVDPRNAVKALFGVSISALNEGVAIEARVGAEKCKEMINSIDSLRNDPDVLLQCAALYLRLWELNLAEDYYNSIISVGSKALKDKQYHAHLGLTIIDIRRLNIDQALGRLDKIERLFKFRVSGRDSWLIDFYRIIALLAKGSLNSACEYLDHQWIRFQIEASSRNQCNLLLNIVRAAYYSGAYNRGMHYLRKAILLATRNGDDEIMLIFFIWALRFRTMISKISPKLVDTCLELQKRLRSSRSKAESGYLLAEHFLMAGLYGQAKEQIDITSNVPHLNENGISTRALNSMRNLVNNYLNLEDFSTIPDEAKESISNFDELIEEGMTHYWRMLLAISADSLEVGTSFRLAQSKFKEVGAHYLVAQTLKYCGLYLSDGRDPTNGKIMLYEANNLFNGMVLPAERVGYTKTEEEQMLDSQSQSLPIKELAEVLELLNSSSNPQKLMPKLLEIAIQGTGASRGLIYLKRDKASGLSRRASVQIGHTEEQAISKTIVQEVFKGRKSIFCDDAVHDDYLGSIKSVRLSKLKSIACIPIVSEGAVVGVLYIDSGPIQRCMNQTQKYYLSLIANLMGTMLTHDRIILRLKSDVTVLRHALEEQDGYGEIKGKSRALQEVFRQLTLLKEYEVPVLILGESGTGKELIARTIHRESVRANKQFVAVNCAAFPEQLIESLLFGHVRGAFTGANSNHSGLFEQADTGTIFLDEIEETSWAMQGKLLRVLEDGEYYRLGESTARRCNVRLISAGKPSLLKQVESGSFRTDLFYRMKVAQIDVPALSDRNEDIPLLANYFLNVYREKYRKDIKRIDPKALQAMQAFPWPGNVRQLEHCVHKAVLSVEAGGSIQIRHLPPEIVVGSQAMGSDNISLADQISAYESARILQALIENNWNRNEVCRKLQLSQASLFRKMRDYELLTDPSAEHVFQK